MKHLTKVAGLTVLMLFSTVQANVATEMFDDVRDTSAYYTEHMCRLAAVYAAGDLVRKHLPTKDIEGLFEFLDKVDFIKENKLREHGTKVVWGAALIAAVRQLTKQKEIKRTLEEAPAVDRLIDWLLDFRARRNK